jgi:phosphoserine phosphatase RsbU/P
MWKQVVEILLREYRTRPMARFSFWAGAYGVALWLVDRFSSGVPGLLWVVFWISAVAAGAYYFARLVALFKDRMLWRLRRRLIVAYIFVAVVPVILIVALVSIGVVMVNGQFAAFLVTQRLGEQLEDLRQINRVVAHEAHMTEVKKPGDLLDRLQRFYLQELHQYSASYPGLEVTLRLGSLTRTFQLSQSGVPKPVALPDWLKGEEFASPVIDHDKLLFRAVDQLETPVGRLTLILTEPLDAGLLDRVGEGIGPVGIMIPARGTPSGSSFQQTSSFPAAVPGFEYPGAALRSKTVAVPRPANFLDRSIFGVSTLDPVVWNGAAETRLSPSVLVMVTSRLWTLNRQLLATLGRYSRVYLTLFQVVGLVFLAIELIALIIGIRLTGSITTTVDNLYDATERVRKGDLAHRIGVSARDQLTALGEAFDTMTASVQRLIRESQEKLRLDNELEIAREVQNQLFPQSVPSPPGLVLYGECVPARGVSGDYYDFIGDGGKVTIVLGDVSGKGISAALLMAAIQSAVRAHFFSKVGAKGAAASGPISTADIVRRLNRQLYETTPPEKYATFFYAVYDAPSRNLLYTNAGHPPPMLFHRDRVERLRTGGTAVGLFRDVSYEEAAIRLEPGDLLLAFTDGITEPENSFEEEFGEERVADTVLRAMDNPPAELAEQIYRAVNEWTGSPELQDDMTLIVARVSS